MTFSGIQKILMNVWGWDWKINDECQDTGAGIKRKNEVECMLQVRGRGEENKQ